MAREYAPKQFLRQAENELLSTYFTAGGWLEKIEWDRLLDETEIDPVYDAWQALPEAQQEEVEHDFRSIHDLASHDGTRTLLEEGQFHQLDLTADLDA